MTQCYRYERTYQGHRKVTIFIFLSQIFCFVVFISYRCVLQKRCLILSQTNSNTEDTKDKRERCFILSWKSHSLLELVEASAERFEKLAGTGTTRSVTVITMADRTTFCNRFAMLDDTRGRLGNQMFKMASLVGIAYKYDLIPVIPDNLTLNKYFNLPNRVPARELNGIVNVTKCDCAKAAVYYSCSDEFKLGVNVSMHGYLQSWKYFEHARSIIRSIFNVETIHTLKAKKFIESISGDGYQRVCMHIRRGDMMTKAKINQGFTTASMRFLDKARAFYVNKYIHVQFLVVSDDKTWCRKNLKNVTVSPFTDPGDDMALMALSDHVIVTTGTFGWWGAWLSGGTTVYFNGHPRPGSMLDLETSKEDYYPSNWVGMS